LVSGNWVIIIYSITPEVRSNNMPARLVVQKGPYPNQEYLLSETPMSLGRSPDNEIAIHDPEVSRRHATITFRGGLHQVEDAGSTNGTFVNGRRVQGTVILQHGDLIQLGESITLLYQDDDPLPGYGPDFDEGHDDYEEVVAETAVVDEEAPWSPPEPAPAWDAPPARSIPQDVPASYSAADTEGPSRTRQILLGCGCGFLLFSVLCIGLLFFLDAYEQGRLLYCGPLYPLFDTLLGPVGFNPAACPR
jgi:hypothetical protein